MDLPGDLTRPREQLEQEVWEESWFPAFRRIHEAYQERLRAIPPSILEKEQHEFVVEFTYDTNRIEGSTLTFQETSDLLIRGLSPSFRPIHDVREAQLHGNLVSRLLAKPEPIDLPHLLAWHKAIFGETKPEIAGRIRDFEVRIGRSRHVPPPPLEVRPMSIELLRRLNRGRGKGSAVERAGRFHFEFENVHPFGDGNGRIGRLAMNMILFEEGYPMLNILFGKRRGYYHALERSSVTGDARPFIQWFFRRYLRDQKYLTRGLNPQLGPSK
ncbi:MAG: Fic family protein [Thermoplasmata archaeon]